MMARKKDKTAIYVVIIILILVAIGIYLVWSGVLWKVLGIEPLFAPFEASVQLANAPPTIVQLFEVTDVDSSNNPIAASPVRDVQPIAAADGGTGIVYSVVEFLVEDPNLATATPNELPGLPATCAAASSCPAIIPFGSPTAANYQIAVRATSPANGIRCTGPGCRTRDAVTGTLPGGATPPPAACYAIDCGGAAGPIVPGCNNGAGVSPYGGLVSEKQRKYRCYAQMQFYDEPSVAAKAAQNDFWSFSLYIEDSTGNSASRTSSSFVIAPWDATDEAYFMDYLTVQGVDIRPTEKLVWTGVSVTASDTIGGDNDIGEPDTGLSFRNRGNLLLSQFSLRPQDLTGDIISAATLEVESMSVDDVVGVAVPPGTTGACEAPLGGGSAPFDASALAGNSLTDVDALGFTIPFNADNTYVSGTNQDELYFCIWQRLDSLTGCAGAACLSGGSTDAAYSANDACGAACDARGELWELIIG